MKKRLDPVSRPTAKRHLHQHGTGFITIVYDKKHPHKVASYKHRPGYDRPLATNNQRVRAGRGNYASR